MTAVPGARLLAIASRWFDASSMSSVFEPLVADWQREWINATPSRRALIRGRGVAAFACAVAVSMPLILSANTPRPVVRSMLARIALFTAAFSVMLSLPMIMELDPLWRETPILLVALPAAVALALPFAVGAGVDAIRRSRPVLPPHVERAAAVKLAIAGCAVMFVLLGWTLPAVSQQWRAAIATAASPAPERGLREFTIVELVTDPWLWRPGSLRFAIGGPNQRGREVRREITQRLSLTALPMLIVWIRWRMIDTAGRYRPLPISVIGAMMLTGFLLFLGSNDLFQHVLLLPPVSASWGPWAALGIIGLVQAFRDMMPTRSNRS